MAREGKEINLILGKNIQLLGFGVLEPSEINIVKGLLQNYVKKIETKTDYNLLKMKLKMHQHNTNFIHELESQLIVHPGKSFVTNVSDKNIYKAIATLMKKLLSEIDHYKRRDVRQRPIKKFSR